MMGRIMGRLGRRGRPSGLEAKRAGELEFWTAEVRQYVRWLRGDLPQLYGVSSPSQDEVVAAPTEPERAIRTWARKDGDKYLRHLGVSADIFQGRRVLEIGCGPLPYSICFTGCDIIGLDPLLSMYREAGYPLKGYDARLRHLCAAAERIPLRTASADGILSVNAIDHVDDFFRAASEIARVVSPDAIILIEAHYHPPTRQEPWVLNDERMTQAFGGLSVSKAAQRPFTDLYPTIPEARDQTLTVWTNRPEEVRKL